MGEGLYSYKCNKVAVTIASYNVCTSDLPVVYKNELRFVAPITRILLEKAAKPQVGSCGTILSPLYKIGDEWITLPDRKATRTPVHIIEEIAMQNLVEFQTLKNIHEGEIYSVEDIEQARRAIHFPQLQERGVIEMITKIYNDRNTGKADYSLLLDTDHYIKTAKNILNYLWGGFTSFGTWISGFTGIYFIIQVIKGLCSMLISGRSLQQTWGCSKKVLLACCPPLANKFIHDQHRREIKSMKALCKPNEFFCSTTKKRLELYLV